MYEKNTPLKLSLEHTMSAIIEKNIENPNKAEVWLSRNNPHYRATDSIPNFQEMLKHQF